jgi:phospholipase/lecithinase/hemolysin
MTGKVTDAIADAVRQLQDLGVSKILVNTLPPVGCQPFRTFNYKYAHCDSLGSKLTDTHNAALRRKLDGVQDVLVLDIHAAFRDVIQDRYAPCCAGDDADVYCGQKDDDGKPLYKLCPDPENYFYWDYIHPTQAAWASVMDNLQPAIQDFLGI